MAETNTIVDELNKRVAAGKRLVDVWDEIGPQNRAAAANERTIHEEIAFLESMAVAHPSRADELERLAERFRDWRRKLRA